MSTKEKTVNIAVDKLEALLAKVEKLEERLDEKDKEIQELHEMRTVHTTSSPRVIHHSLEAIRQRQAEQSIQHREQVDHLLSEATEYILKDIKQNPIKGR